jgi:mono/diheme cytochrome c family protein
MRRRLKTLAIATALGFVPGGAVLAQPDGKALFEKHCVKCHGADGKAQTKEGKLVKAHSFHENPKLATDEGPALVVQSVREKKKHKPVTKKLDDAELAAIAEYVRVLLVGSGTAP